MLFRSNVMLSDKAKIKVIEESFDKEFGARPVKRYLTKYIENIISKYILENEITETTELLIDVENEEYKIKCV